MKKSIQHKRELKVAFEGNNYSQLGQEDKGLKTKH